MTTRRLSGIAFTLVLLWLSAAVFVAPKMALNAPDNPVDVSPGDVDLAYQDVTIESDGLRLPGWWMEADSPRAILLWVHGGGSNRHSTFFNSLGFYKALHGANVSVLTFDQRNHGNAPRDTGLLSLGLRESRDVAAALDWLNAHNTEGLPVILMGVSMGGASAIHALSDGAHASALILTDAVLNPMDVLARGGWIAYGVPSAFFLPMSWGAVLFEGIQAGSAAPLALAEQLELPVLFLQSPDDPITRAVYARELAEAKPEMRYVEAPPVSADAPCINFKGRWGSHASAYLCHPEWTMQQVMTFLAPIVQ